MCYEPAVGLEVEALARPMQINGQSALPGERRPLQEGDRLRLGRAVLEVVPAPPPPLRESPPAGGAPASTPRPAPDDLLTWLAGHLPERVRELGLAARRAVPLARWL